MKMIIPQSNSPASAIPYVKLVMATGVARLRKKMGSQKPLNESIAGLYVQRARFQERNGLPYLAARLYAKARRYASNPHPLYVAQALAHQQHSLRVENRILVSYEHAKYRTGASHWVPEATYAMGLLHLAEEKRAAAKLFEKGNDAQMADLTMGDALIVLLRAHKYITKAQMCPRGPAIEAEMMGIRKELEGKRDQYKSELDALRASIPGPDVGAVR